MFMKRFALCFAGCVLATASNAEDAASPAYDTASTTAAQNEVVSTQPHHVAIGDMSVSWQERPSFQDQTGSTLSLVAVTFTELDPQTRAPIASPSLSVNERLKLAKTAIELWPSCSYYGYDPEINVIDGFRWKDHDNIIVVLAGC
ncbi:hypothetical protein SAMN04488518_104321 [Pseudovibrio ascidiaceicola]|uniref:Uncharacterized protein n=1 Tax=Pseudovibrio ascidiaceicola TaxID=285279 RepID=A0A1I3YZ99_9HYPH|nr:hypothetical protein [Pseudovibrio ascidiaceicola]SFK37133.1 hypothetical protein SAMN04488518_104321 [Pseudovibrio ascidiaceicola]